MCDLVKVESFKKNLQASCDEWLAEQLEEVLDMINREEICPDIGVYLALDLMTFGMELSRVTDPIDKGLAAIKKLEDDAEERARRHEWPTH